MCVFRTGKRTQWGLVMDGWNSMIRYYKNNFSDGFRQVRFSLLTHSKLPLFLSYFRISLVQDSIDLFLGNYAVDEADMSTNLHEAKDWKFLTVRNTYPPTHTHALIRSVCVCEV